MSTPLVIAIVVLAAWLPGIGFLYNGLVRRRNRVGSLTEYGPARARA